MLVDKGHKRPTRGKIKRGESSKRHALKGQNLHIEHVVLVTQGEPGEPIEQKS